MPELGRILLADDELTFLRSTAELLREEGYECDCSPDGRAVVEMLKKEEYDLLIADIKMPGNSELELIHELPRIAEGLPVILVTGYPSLNSAIRSMQLPVVSYLVKPLEFDELLAQIRTSIRRFRIYRSLGRMQKRSHYWQRDMSDLRDILKNPSCQVSKVPVDVFFNMAFRNVFGFLLDLKRLMEKLGGSDKEEQTCNSPSCTRATEQINNQTQAIAALERAEGVSKSKQPGNAGSRLEKPV